MSSFEKPAGKNLDEILASIRKTLADESTQPPPRPKDPSVPAPARSEARQSGGSPSGKTDDDLADLLAGDLTAPIAEKDGSDGPTPDAKDPLWFLRPSPAHEPRPSLAEPSAPVADGQAEPRSPPPSRPASLLAPL